MKVKRQKTFLTTIDKKGKLDPIDSRQFVKFLKENHSHNLILKCEAFSPKDSKFRSSAQNAYYWGIVIASITDAMNEQGNNFINDDVHEFMKNEIGLRHRMRIGGSDVYRDVIRSTRKYTTAEFEEYMEACRAWAAEYLNIQIPLPKEGLLYEQNKSRKGYTSH